MARPMSTSRAAFVTGTNIIGQLDLNPDLANTDLSETYRLLSQALGAGTYTLTVQGTRGAIGSYGGNVAFQAGCGSRARHLGDDAAGLRRDRLAASPPPHQPDACPGGLRRISACAFGAAWKRAALFIASVQNLA